MLQPGDAKAHTVKPSKRGVYRGVYRHADLVRVLSPQSIAIIGASTNPASFASVTLTNLAQFDGNVHLVNAKYERVGARACFPSVSALPEVPDCAIITVGRESVEPIVEECASLGVGGLVIYAAGYSETGKPERVAQQARLSAIARASGMRIIGPNVVGLFNHRRRFSMTFTPEAKYAPMSSTSIGLISQSGGVSNALTQALNHGVSFSHTLSAGNSCDVDMADYVSYLADDPGCRSIALAFEGLEAPERLIEAGEIAWQADKPLVVFKFAQGVEGATAALSHTGFLAGSNAAYRAAFERVGAVVVDSYQTLVETAAFFAKAGAPKAKGLGVIASSGGFAVLAADQAEARGVPLPQPGETTRAILEAAIPEFGSARNPCDVTAQIQSNPQMLFDCLQAMFRDPVYGAVLMPYFYVRSGADMLKRTEMFIEIARAHGKMALIAWVTDWLEGPGALELEAESGIAVFRSMDFCMAALAAWHKRGDRRLAWEENGPRRLERVSAPEAARAAADLIDAAPNCSLTEREAKDALAVYGVPVVGERLTNTAAEAASAARAAGFPVALKVESPDLPHKTEAGVIRLNLKSEAEVMEAYDAVMSNANRVVPRPRINGVLVQAMIPAGTEVMVGARIDPQFGPLVVVGLGGVLVELLKDSVAELAPVTRREALGMLARLKHAVALKGFRGAEPVALDRLADVIVRVSEFAADQQDRIAELDVNPLICAGRRITAVDALIVKRAPMPGA